MITTRAFRRSDRMLTVTSGEYLEYLLSKQIDSRPASPTQSCCMIEILLSPSRTSMRASLHRPRILRRLSSSVLAIYSLGWSAGIALASSIFRTPASAMSLPHDTSPTATRTIKVVVWSDLACPWCYVGQKRLAQGIAKFQAEQKKDQNKKSDAGADRQPEPELVGVHVEWKPYMIDPGTNALGEDMEAYCRRRWGGSGWTHHLRQEGSKSGATFGNWKWWSHTGLAHQWVQYGKERHGASTDRMNSILFEAVYESGQNLSSLDVLVELAREHFPEWDANDLRSYLGENRGWDAVQREIQEGRSRYRVSSVPFFVIGTEPQRQGSKPYALSGAQSSSTFAEIFHELSEADE